MPDSAKMSEASLRRLSSTVTLVVALVLTVVKVWAWLATGSVALLGSSLDAAVDTLASLFTFVGVRYAAQPADRDHRFGHGKGEALAAFLQAVVLAGAGLVLGVQAALRLVRPEPLPALGLGLWVLAGTLCVVVGLVTLQSWVLRRTPSTALAADRAHYLTDVLVNVAVLVALGLTALTHRTVFDPLFGLGVAAYMIWNGRGIAIDALAQLLDRELPDAQRRSIEDAVLGCAGVRGTHDIRSRNAGDRVFVELHLEVDGSLSVSRGHAIADDAESAVRRLFPRGAEVTAHVEPAGLADARLDDRVDGRRGLDTGGRRDADGSRRSLRGSAEQNR